MNVSFIIATCRDNKFVNKTIDSINALPQGKYNYEILIYGPNELSGKNVTWFKEEELRGPHYGFNYLVNRSQGEYIYQLVDDMAIHANGWNAIDFLQSDTFKDRKYKITTLNTCHAPVRLEWPLGKLRREDATASDEWIPNHLCMRFPVVHRETIDKHFQKFFYHPELYYHQADAWMGYWIGETGETGLECLEASATLHSHGLISHAHDVTDTHKYFDLIHTFKSGNHKYVRNESSNTL